MTNKKDNRNNGLITKIWGNSTWTSNHAITFGYPIEPSEEQKNDYRNYFMLLGKVLPCRYCRDSYTQFINDGDAQLTDKDLESRDGLTRWFYRMHNAVNNKLGVDYGVTYEELVNRFESFRAKCGNTDPAAKGCVAPLDYKAFSFKKLYQLDCPIVSYEKIQPFLRLAELRNINKNFFCFVELADILDGDFAELKKQSCWEYRNKICQQLIKIMREEAIPSIEINGKWKGTPTIPELILMLFLCSNLNKDEINQCLDTIINNKILG
jgi:Erv1 / Alr family